jgi:hypothetical protein
VVAPLGGVGWDDVDVPMKQQWRCCAAARKAGDQVGSALVARDDARLAAGLGQLAGEQGDRRSFAAAGLGGVDAQQRAQQVGGRARPCGAGSTRRPGSLMASSTGFPVRSIPDMNS